MGEKVHVKSISKMLKMNAHKRKCLAYEQREVEAAASISLSLGKQFDIQEFRWNFVPLGVSLGHKKSVEVGLLSKCLLYVTGDLHSFRLKNKKLF